MLRKSFARCGAYSESWAVGAAKFGILRFEFLEFPKSLVVLCVRHEWIILNVISMSPGFDLGFEFLNSKKGLVRHVGPYYNVDRGWGKRHNEFSVYR
jgi:hypothetical protein